MTLLNKYAEMYGFDLHQRHPRSARWIPRSHTADPTRAAMGQSNNAFTRLPSWPDM
ncbi:MAG: hypothetical protein ACLR2E_04835 [Lachnospiraceae bacterium]